MDGPCNCHDTDDTDDVYSAGSDLIRQFSKVLEKMKLRQLPTSRDDEQQAGEGRERPKLMEAAGGCGCQVGCGNSSNADLGRGALCCRQLAVRMEPTELRLVIRLEPWVSEDGELIVRQSLVTEADGGSDARNCGDSGRGPGAAAADTETPRAAAGAKLAAADKAKPGQLLGSIQGRQLLPQRQVGAGSAAGDAGQQLRQQPRQQQQQLQQLRQRQQQTNNHQDNFRSSGGESGESADDRSSSGDILPASPIGGGRRQQPPTTFGGLSSAQRVRGGGKFGNNK